MKPSIRRFSSAAVLSVLCACTAGASLAWACAPSSWGFGAPDTPESTPTSGGNAPATGSPGGSSGTQGGSLTPAEASPAEPAQGQSQSGQRAESPSKNPARQPARSPGGAPSAGGGTLNRGAPAGLANRSRSQSSSAVGGASTSNGSGSPGGARAAKSKKAKPSTATPSPRTAQAAIDASAWSAGDGRSASLMPGAAGTPDAGGGLGFGGVLLGLGVAGLCGGLAAAQVGRRRAHARRVSR